MGLFPKRRKHLPQGNILQAAARYTEEFDCLDAQDVMAQGLYGKLRRAVPILDAAISKVVRLAGGFQLVCESDRMQAELEEFVKTVPVGLGGQSLQTFADSYLDSLLTFGNALGEILVDTRTGQIAGLQTLPPDCVAVRQGKGLEREFWLRQGSEDIKIRQPERVLFTAMNPPPGGIYGVSILQGLPALSQILLRIYECIGQNYDRIGNVRYAVTYKPGNDPSERAYAADRAKRIAQEWSEGMRAGSRGEIRDFVCAGDVDIRVIGADNTMLDTEVPVRQLMEQLVAKLSVPPFLLGLSWSTTERMSSQQADILTSELEYYRRLIEPVLVRIGTAFLRLGGSQEDVTVQWENINLQDETELAQARLWNAQAEEIEQRLNGGKTAAEKE